MNVAPLPNGPPQLLSLRFRARLAGILYLLALLIGVLGETLLQGSLGLAAALLAVACNIAATLILYRILKIVDPRLSFLAAFFNLVGLACEAFRWNPHGTDIALVFHGLYCLLIGYVVFRARFLPRVLGILIEIAALGWLTYLLPSFANFLSPYNLAAGLLGEAPLMLWLLVMSTNVQEWQEQAGGRATG